MKKSFFLFFAFVMVLPIWAQNNVITYTASEKLKDTTGLAMPGLHVNDFNVPIISHTFSDGVGIITFSGNVTYLFSDVFYGCSSLISITLPNTVTNICSGAFSGCSNLSSINIPSSVKEIGQSAFYHCSSLTTITIPSSVTKLESDVFDGCSSLTSITLPNSIQIIDFAAFRNCYSLTSFTIPDSVLRIGDEAFRGCTGLTSVTIPNSVTSIGDWAFAYCNGLTSITCKANTPPALESDVFQDVPRYIPLYVPAGSIPLYQAAAQWNEFDISYAACTYYYWFANDIDATTNSLTHNQDSFFSGGSRGSTPCIGTITVNDCSISITKRGGNSSTLTLSFSIPEHKIGTAYILASSGGTSDRTITLSNNSNYSQSGSTSAGSSPSAIIFENLVSGTYNFTTDGNASISFAAVSVCDAGDYGFEIADIISVSPGTTNLTWLPFDSAALYQLRIYSNQIAVDTTLSILADPDNGGTHLLSLPSPYRQPRIVLDDGVGTLVVVVFDDNSGATPSQPFVVSVSTASSYRIDLQYDMTVFGITDSIIHQESGIFTLNEGALLYDALDEVSYSPTFIPSSCFDLRGNSYPLSQWSSLPAGIYILHDGTSVRKILRH